MEKSKGKTMRSVIDWFDSIENEADLPEQPADGQAHAVQMDSLVRQASEQLTTLVKSMTGTVTALQSTAVPTQQNHLLVLETQITYLQQLAQDLKAITELTSTNESE